MTKKEFFQNVCISASAAMHNHSARQIAEFAYQVTKSAEEYWKENDDAFNDFFDREN